MKIEEIDLEEIVSESTVFERVVKERLLKKALQKRNCFLTHYEFVELVKTLRNLGITVEKFPYINKAMTDVVFEIFWNINEADWDRSRQTYWNKWSKSVTDKINDLVKSGKEEVYDFTVVKGEINNPHSDRFVGEVYVHTKTAADYTGLKVVRYFGFVKENTKNTGLKTMQQATCFIKEIK